MTRRLLLWLALLKKIENTQLLQRYGFIVGSISYNFIDRVLEKVFGRAKLRIMRKTLHCIEDIRLAQKNPEQQSKWEAFAINWDAKLEEALEQFAKDRVESAHPTTINEDDEQSPTPKDLIQVLDKVYVNKRYKGLKIQGEKHKLVRQTLTRVG